MNSKLLSSAFAAALLLAPAVAFAQADTATATSGNEAKTEAKAPAVHHSMKSSHETVGMSYRSMAKSRPGGEPISRKPAD